MSDFNQQMIEEFRANSGKVSGYFADRDMILLTTTGAKSGTKRTVPLVYFNDDGRILIIASKGGAPTHPDWYHNLKANPEATAEIGTESFQATAVELIGEERDQAFAKVVAAMPGFGEYQDKVTRVIPVLELVRSS